MILFVLSYKKSIILEYMEIILLLPLIDVTTGFTDNIT